MPSKELPKKMSPTQVDMLFFLILLDLRNPIRVNQWTRGKELINERIISKNIANKNSDLAKSLETIMTQENAVRMVVLNARGVIPYIMDLDYKLIKNVSKIPFIISDNPLVKYNQFLEKRKWNIGGHSGYSTIGLQIFLPINDSYLLVIYDSNVYKVGNRKETVVEIDDEHSINQLNLLQYLNCSETIFFNHKISKFYIEKLKNKAKNYQKANIPFSEFFQVGDDNGNIRENEEAISIGATDLKINLNLQKINFHSKSIAIKLDNRAAQMRPKAEQFYIYEQKKEKLPQPLLMRASSSSLLTTTNKNRHELEARISDGYFTNPLGFNNPRLGFWNSLSVSFTNPFGLYNSKFIVKDPEFFFWG